jgi:hypothetical protein
VAKLREAVADALPDVLDAMVRAARAGDVGAARLLMERTLPASLFQSRYEPGAAGSMDAARGDPL